MCAIAAAAFAAVTATYSGGGGVSSSSTNADLVVTPVVVTRPANCKTIKPVPCDLSVVIGAVPVPTIHWMSSADGITFTAINGATSTTYRAKSLVAGTTFYRVSVTSGPITVFSKAAKVKVKDH